MKKIIIFRAIPLLTVAICPILATAQGSVDFLSNIGQASGGGTSVASDSWAAAGFQTGNDANGYVLNSVRLEMTDASGVPIGFTVMIYTDAGPGGIVPGKSLSELSGSSDPTTAGVYTFTPVSSLTLLPDAIYFVVLTANTKIASGAYEWSYANANTYNPAGEWGSLAGGWTSGNGTSWNASSAVFSQFAINATAAPEPGTLGLLALGGLVFGLRRWNEKKRS